MNDVGRRIEKNVKKLEAWATRHGIDAYRIYERDIPEYPFIVDRYICEDQDQFVVYDRGNDVIDSKDEKQNHLPQLIEGLCELFMVNPDRIIVKRRARQKGDQQYEKIDSGHERQIVREGEARFWVNLHDYLDTGLFLDHRLMRQRIMKESKDKDVLNLFSYTGSVSVFSALGGGRTTSVDMSATYIRWSQDNFALNQLPLDGHEFVNQNALEYLTDRSIDKRFDLIFLDPPTFSNSKKMHESFEVEREQEMLVSNCIRLLKPGGVLYFSNNKRSFRLSENIKSQYATKDITALTLPKDFRDPKIHHVFEIKEGPCSKISKADT